MALKTYAPLKRKTLLKAKKSLKSYKGLKTYKPLKAKTSLKVDGKKLSNGGIKRSPLKAKVKKTPKRFSILTQDMNHCYLCTPSQRKAGDVIEIHEVYFGPFRQKSITYGCTAPLCSEHHRGKKGVHQNIETNMALKQKCQEKFEELYSHEEFMSIFKKDYLQKEDRNNE